MFITLAGTLAIAAVLTGGAILRGSPAAADSNQDEQFLQLLGYHNIPALKNPPTLVNVAHKVCSRLDAGMPVEDLIAEMKNASLKLNPVEVLFPPARVRSTLTRFITASVDTYCPDDRGKIASIMANPAAASGKPVNWIPGSASSTAHPRRGLRERSLGAATITLTAAWQPTGAAWPPVPAGEIISPNPPEIPPPPPPAAQILTPHPPIATPAPRKRPPPAAPPEPEQPPAAGPSPGNGEGGNGGGSGGDGSGNGADGGGGNGGAGPAEPMAPGFVRLAP